MRAGRGVSGGVGSALSGPHFDSPIPENHETVLGDLFSKVLMMCADAGLVRLGRVALDRTNIKADAALDRNRTLSVLREKVATWMSEAEKTDREEDGNRFPPGVARKAGPHQEMPQRSGGQAGERREKTGEDRAGSDRRPLPLEKAQGHPSGSRVPQAEPH